MNYDDKELEELFKNYKIEEFCETKISKVFKSSYQQQDSMLKSTIIFKLPLQKSKNNIE
jgi:hypothetical protein